MEDENATVWAFDSLRKSYDALEDLRESIEKLEATLPKVDATVIPMLMQLARPEYMCTACDAKFFIDTEYKGKYPTECRYCQATFNWDYAKKLRWYEESIKKI